MKGDQPNEAQLIHLQQGIGRSPFKRYIPSLPMSGIGTATKGTYNNDRAERA